jgi:hypothetical protein
VLRETIRRQQMFRDKARIEEIDGTRNLAKMEEILRLYYPLCVSREPQKAQDSL